MDVFRPNDTFLWMCGHQPSQTADKLRFVLVGVIGSIVAATSLLCNAILLYVFSTSRRLRRQNYANPVLLALFDIIVSVCYFLLFSIQMTSYHYHMPRLITLWIQHAQFVYVIKHICESICNFLLLIASFERLLANSPQGRQKHLLVFMVQRKIFVFLSLVAVSVLLKGTLLVETTIQRLSHCIDQYLPVQTRHIDKVAHARFWSRKSLTVIIPFIILTYCNYCIVRQLRNKQREQQQQSIKKRSTRSNLTTASIRKHYADKKGVRVATRTLVMVVGCYLLSNVLVTIINFVEFLSIHVVQEHYYAFLIFSDIAWLMTIVGCACRLPIYCLSDGRIRKAVGRAFFRFRIRALPTEVQQKQLDKWSIVIVSNSLRSNLTNVNNLFASGDWMNDRSKRAKDELAFLLQTRRRMLVDMTFRLAGDRSVETDNSTREDWLTDIQEEESHWERRSSRFRSICAASRLLSADENEELTQNL